MLCALPALLAEGLLRHTRTFYRLRPGFYPLESIFLALALLALVRSRSLEQSRYLSPGEWGKLLGLHQSIVPRLLAQAPQPEAQALEADPLLPRLTLIRRLRDREGYSPDFFAELKAQRIAILTYHKFPGQPWPIAEFAHHLVHLPSGETVELELAAAVAHLCELLTDSETFFRPPTSA
jgi:hypothetical protein